MCESYHLKCACGMKEAEIFFGKMLLDERAVNRLLCPLCSGDDDRGGSGSVWDNGWVLQLDMELIRAFSASFGRAATELTAEWIFDQGYVTWVGVTPEDRKDGNRERKYIQALANTDLPAYIKAITQWGIARERRFMAEGWRKMQNREPPGKTVCNH